MYVFLNKSYFFFLCLSTCEFSSHSPKIFGVTGIKDIFCLSICILWIMQSPKIKYLKYLHSLHILIYIFSIKWHLYVPKKTAKCIILINNSLSPILTKVYCICFFNYNSNSGNFILKIPLFPFGKRDSRQANLMEDSSSFCKQLKTLNVYPHVKNPGREDDEITFTLNISS